VNLATIRAAIKTAVVAASGLSDSGAVEWKGAKESAYGRPLIRCDMSLRSIRGVGGDELRREYNEDDDVQDVTICGQRQGTLTLRFETQDGSDSGIALGYATRAMARLMRPSNLETLRAAKVSIAGFESIQTFDNVKAQDRFLSVAVLDVQLNMAEVDTDDTEGVGEFIESVQIDSDTLDNEAGDPVGNQISLLVESV
jgi:hypothetical protein